MGGWMVVGILLKNSPPSKKSVGPLHEIPLGHRATTPLWGTDIKKKPPGSNSDQRSLVGHTEEGHEVQGVQSSSQGVLCGDRGGGAPGSIR